MVILELKIENGKSEKLRNQCVSVKSVGVENGPYRTLEF